MPPSPLASGHKLTCVSYAPFHGDQAPFTWDLNIPDKQIASDLKTLSQTTACIRTYSARGAQGRVPRLAAALGLKVLQGIWLGRNLADNRREIEAALRLARRYPATVRSSDRRQ
jgi:glucan 1,3-beta-glucosidase